MSLDKEKSGGRKVGENSGSEVSQEAKKNFKQEQSLGSDALETLR